LPNDDDLTEYSPKLFPGAGTVKKPRKAIIEPRKQIRTPTNQLQRDSFQLL
jgi:hypothetical protein